MRALVYDIEIEKAILGRGEKAVPGIEYCEGWRDHAGMGVSCICVYDYMEERYRVFGKGNFDDFLVLCIQRELLVGFNNINFDNQVIKECLASTFPEEKCYDLLREVWKANGLGAVFVPATHGGYGLDAMCQANGLGRKTGNGALAPVWWQQGQYGRVIDYCLNDILLTKKLFDLAIDHHVKDPKSGYVLHLRNPREQ